MSRKQGVQRFLVVTVFMCVGVLWWTADEATAGPRWGLHGALNFANMGGDMDQLGADLEAELEAELGGDWTASKGSLTGVGFGAYYYAPRSPTLGIQVEAQYIRRGAKFDLDTSGLTAETKFELNYFEIPVLLRLSPPAAGSTRFFFVVGPVLGLKTGANLVVSANNQSDSIDASDGFKSTVFGVVGGAGLTTSLGVKTSLSLQARYHLGLSNALDDEAYTSSAGDFAVMAGLEFDLIK